MVVVKVGIIVVFGLAMIPHWNLSNITAFPQASVFFRDVLLTIPFCFFSAVFIQVLNPMNIAYRKREADRLLATRMAIRTHRISYITLIAVILFFSFSFTFSITHEEAVSAFEQNISALALAAPDYSRPDYPHYLDGAEYLCGADGVLWDLSGVPRGDERHHFECAGAHR